MNLYLAGPMRGKLLYGLHDFAAASWALRSKGHTVFNPMERDLAMSDNPLLPHQDLEDQDFDLLAAMTADIQFIASDECDGIALLPGWQDSRGAIGEIEVANICGRQLFELDARYSLSPVTIKVSVVEVEVVVDSPAEA